MSNCTFCNLDCGKIENTIIDKADDFIVVPSKGSLVEGYVLVVPKIHVTSINELNNNQKESLLFLIKKYRKRFKEIYGRYPIVFEHGTGCNGITSSSVVHAHIHLVNHNFFDENKIIDLLNLKKVDKDEFYKYKGESYIAYISFNFDYYISYNFNPCSQQMRKFIAQDLEIGDKYDWKNNDFEDNIKRMLEKFNDSKCSD